MKNIVLGTSLFLLVGCSSLPDRKPNLVELPPGAVVFTAEEIGMQIANYQMLALEMLRLRRLLVVLDHKQQCTSYEGLPDASE